MKYKNFAKAAVMDGLLCRDPDGNNWLCHGNVAMKVPVSDRALYSAETDKALPKEVYELVVNSAFEVSCDLDRAYLPEADSPAKDVVRVYEDMYGKVSIGISNANWALLEDDDIEQIAYHPNGETLEPLALTVYSYPDIPTEEFTLRGVIFPVTAKED